MKVPVAWFEEPGDGTAGRCTAGSGEGAWWCKSQLLDLVEPGVRTGPGVTY